MSRVILGESRTIILRMSLTSRTIESPLKVETTGMRIEEARSIESRGKKVLYSEDMITLHFILYYECKISSEINEKISYS